MVVQEGCPDGRAKGARSGGPLGEGVVLCFLLGCVGVSFAYPEYELFDVILVEHDAVLAEPGAVSGLSAVAP